MRVPLHPLFLLTFAKEPHFLSFHNFLDFLEFFHIFLAIFSNRTATPLRIARFVAVWRRAATPAATAIFIHAHNHAYTLQEYDFNHELADPHDFFSQ